MAKANQERSKEGSSTYGSEEVMDSKSKHHLGQVGVEDRISQLPGTLRCHILSLMPTLYAVRTTILSKSWNNLWISVPNLDFDQDDFSSFETNRLGVWCPFEKFATFVDRVLSLLESSNIRKFRIHCDVRRVGIRQEYVSRIHGWICAATTRYNIVELDLDIHVGCSDLLKLPKSVFTCKTLVVLKVINLGLCDPNLNLTWTSSLFPSLKSLHYRDYNPDNASLEKLLSNCHALEHLTIDGCIVEKDVYNFNISAPALKTFRILDSVCRDDSHEYRFSINAPKLENLVVWGDAYCLPKYCLVSAKSLTKARIYITSKRDLNQDHVDRAAALLAGVSRVKYLSLSTHRIFAGSLPQCFNNLKRLKVTLFSYSYWDYVVELLKRSPNLEDLVLNFDHDTWNEEKYVEGYEPFKPPEFVPVCILSHLKTIFISDFMGYDDEFEVMKYLLKYGEVLKKITISTHGLFIFETRHMTEDKFRKECLEIQKLSKTCEVDVKFRTNKQVVLITCFDCGTSSNVLIKDE